MKKVLVLINYYYPYVSGVTEYARVVCEKLAAEGHSITVLTENYADLPQEEMICGVRVIRAPIIGKISKGTVSPAFLFRAWRMAKQFDIVNFHIPMLESGVISLFIPRRKIYATFHCDICLPRTLFNNFVTAVMDLSQKICFSRSTYILAGTYDYARHSRTARKYAEKLFEVSLPIKDMPMVGPWMPSGKKKVGFCGRIVEEKGIDVLIKAFHALTMKRDDVELLIAGDYSTVAGGSIYPSLVQYIQDNAIPNIRFLGKLEEEKLPAFYSSLDVFVLPSVSAMESFGLVQIEAMLCGTPVVASDLYGVRTVVQKTGMGLVAKAKDAEDLRRCIEIVIDHRDTFVKSRSYIESLYNTSLVIGRYRKIFGLEDLSDGQRESEEKLE